METRKNRNNLLAGLAGLLGVIVIVSLIGLYAAKPEPLIIQGEVEAKEYRVSGKIPGRISEILAEEGSSVEKGDTLALIFSPELNAKLDQAKAARDAAQAQNRKAIKGARPEQIMGAFDSSYDLFRRKICGKSYSWSYPSQDPSALRHYLISMEKNSGLRHWVDVCPGLYIWQ